MMLKTANSLVVAIALLSGCNDSSNGFKSENLKFIAPSFNPEIKALVLADGFGATTSEIFSVRIRQGNKAPEEVLKLDHVRNLTVQWKGEKSLEINMDCGKIFNFTKFFMLWIRMRNFCTKST